MDTSNSQSAEPQDLPETTETAADQLHATEESPSESASPEFPIHPYAASFPMLEVDDLEVLAEDIRLNGLRNPITLDQTGQVLDGRNRLRACQLAGVEPTFTTIDADDPIAFILSQNVHRRHLSKGQQAMAFAMAYPEATDKGGRGKKTTVSNTGVSGDYITKARFVLHHAPDLGVKVMGGSSLPEAYALASKQKQEQEEYDRLLTHVREHLDSIVGVCLRLKSHTDKPASAFLGQADFVKQVRSDVKEVIEYATHLKDHV